MKKNKNSFREWVSDNLRYLILLLAFILGVFAIVLGVRMYGAYQEMRSERQEQATEQLIVISDVAEKETQKQTETEKKTEVQTESKAEKESETAEPQSIVEKNQTEKSADPVTDTDTAADKSETTVQTETQEVAQGQMQDKPAAQQETQKESQKETQKETQNQSETAKQPETKAPETQPETQKETEEIDTLQTYKSQITRYSSTSSNVRSGPGTKYVTIGTADEGQALTITGETNGWYQVSFDGQRGYIAKGLTVEEYTPDYRTVTSACNVRSEASYGDNVIIYDLPAGTVVEYLGGEGWCKIRLDDGTIGYIGAGFLS